MSTSASRSRALTPAQSISMLLVFLLLSAAGGVVGAGFAMPLVGATSAITQASAKLFDELPTDFNILKPSQVSVIKSSDGADLARFYAENRVVVPLDQISPNMRNAIVSVEDQRFYQHKGVDPKGILRALVANSNGGSQGASTLTQQYVRNVLIEAGLQSGDPSQVAAATEGSISRKLREIKYALTVEQKYSKDQILEGYLNMAAFSPSTYGVEASAQHYFSKSAADLTIPEAALLAGLTNAPSAYDPLTHPDKAKSRMDWVLNKMLEEEFITQEEYQAGVDTSVESLLNPSTTGGGCSSAGNAAYFCLFVVNEIYASPLFGETPAERRQLLQRGGLTITTTLDPAQQQAAYATIQANVPTGDPSNVKAAIAAIEPGTGRIKAMAQNTNFGEQSAADPTATQISFNADTLHGGLGGFQPGSVAKSFLLAAWYQLGKSPYAVVDGTGPHTFPPSTWTISCSDRRPDAWTVSNSVPSETGPYTVLEATHQSINVAYANMLSQIDICQMTDLAAKLGVTQPDGSPLPPLPATILGTENLPPLSAANAYATFAAHGKYCRPIAIDSIVDSDGASLEVPSADCTQVMDTTAADRTTVTLEGTLSGSGTARASALAGRPAAGKTGTTEQMDNAWFVGYTPELSSAVWLGHSEGLLTMRRQYIGGRYFPTMYGNDLAAPMWRDFMNEALAGVPAAPFAPVDMGAPAAPSRAAAVDQSSDDDAEGDE